MLIPLVCPQLHDLRHRQGWAGGIPCEWGSERGHQLLPLHDWRARRVWSELGNMTYVGRDTTEEARRPAWTVLESTSWHLFNESIKDSSFIRYQMAQEDRSMEIHNINILLNGCFFFFSLSTSGTMSSQWYNNERQMRTPTGSVVRSCLNTAGKKMSWFSVQIT